MSDPQLRVLAVTAPHWPVRPKDIKVRSFDAETPFSLQNAARQAAGQAEAQHGAWKYSNWTTLEGRRNSVLLLKFMDEAEEIFQRTLRELRPNLLLIGAMTLGFPGAVRLAQIAREEMGAECFVVLGGKHCSETLRLQSGVVDVSPISPLTLMRSGVIPAVGGQAIFDCVVSGQGEEVVTWLGEMIFERVNSGRVTTDGGVDGKLLKKAKGRWIAGWLDNGDVTTIAAAGIPLDFVSIPTAPKLFGLQSRFTVFNDVITGHAYSDMGMGCKYNCFFCSERSGLYGKLIRHSVSVDRLVEHLRDIWVAGGGPKGETVGAFVEDSVLLGGESALIEELLTRLRRERLRGFRIGCQLTVNDIEKLHDNGMLAGFKEVGIEYVAFGMETVNEGVAARMSKHRRKGLWSEANRRALKYLAQARLRAGVYVLWGLGETQDEREHQLQQLNMWCGDYGGQPCAVGLNWAVRHPGVMATEPVPNFLKWGTDSGSQLYKYFVEMFGEASEKYPLRGADFPSPSGLKRLRKEFTAGW